MKQAFNSRARRMVLKSGAALGLLAALNAAVLTPAAASVGSEMTGYFDSAGVRANATGPTAFQGQEAGYYSGGNVWTRFPQKSIKPFDLQLPSVRAGCGGIDIFAGSFSFINTAELVAMLKATANNAIGFAFQLAIDAISPQISGVIKDMAQKVQQFTQHSISSCETAQGLVGGLWPKMAATKQTICRAVGSGQGIFSDWAAAHQGCGVKDQMAPTLAANTNAELKNQLVGEKHNFTWDILEKSPQFAGYDKEFKEYVMTLLGTVTTEPSTDPTKGTIVKTFGPADDSLVQALLDGTAATPGLKYLQCGNAECTIVNEVPLTITSAQAILPRVKALIVSMAQAVRNNTAIGPAEKTLLNVASLPLYKIVAVQAASHADIVGTGDTIAEITSIDLLQAIVDDILGKFDMAKVGLVKADESSAALWRAQVQGVRTRFAHRELNNSQRVTIAMKIIESTVQLESTLQNGLSPQMSAALNFSRGLSAQGLR
jgi:conjugative transfer pilus assembly protein TraH